MQYEIKGGAFPVVIMALSKGETVVTEAGGMSWMSGNMKMDTNMKGGLFGGLRLFCRKRGRLAGLEAAVLDGPPLVQVLHNVGVVKRGV